MRRRGAGVRRGVLLRLLQQRQRLERHMANESGPTQSGRALGGRGDGGEWPGTRTRAALSSALPPETSDFAETLKIRCTHEPPAFPLGRHARPPTRSSLRSLLLRDFANRDASLHSYAT